MTMEKTKNMYKVGLLWLILGLSVSGSAQISSNVDVLRDVFLNPVESCLDSIAEPASAIRIKDEASSEIGKWLTENLRKRLLNNGFSVYESDSVRNLWDYTVVLETVEANIYYRPIGRDLILRDNKFERQFYTLFSYYIKNKNESIEHTHSKSKVVKDTLTSTQLKEVENNLLPFSKGRKLETGWKQKIFEPVIVTAATIVVIYLFFSLRSG
jgi:hypothetical protein